MRVLGIETSGTLGGFAVVDGGQLLCELTSNITGRHVEHGVGMIKDVLGRASLSLDEVDAVAVSLGPGSFTGLRVGLATAKGICLARSLPLVGVPTLDCMAEGASCWDGLVVPMRDARRGEIYFSAYESKACSVTRLLDYMAVVPEQVVSTINDVSNRRPVLLLGDAITKYGDLVTSGLVSEAALAPGSIWTPRPGIVAVVGCRLLNEGAAADLDSIEPIYVRPSEAERKAMRHLRDGIAEDKKND
jgi:tRNA threonylcarbamoyladenosine biosynthesis protein TsaB